MLRELLETLGRVPVPKNPLRAPATAGAFGGRQSVRVAGLRDAVDVFFAEGSVPHIFARTERDAYFVQGYITARDRLFQMDFARRSASGTLAEILGEMPLPHGLAVGAHELTHGAPLTIVDADRLMRTLGLRRAALSGVGRLSPATAEALQCYCEGVNAALTREPLPPECALLGYTPDPWTPADTLAILKGWAFELSTSWQLALLNDALARALKGQPDDAELLALTTPRDGLTTTRLYIPDEQVSRWLEPDDPRSLVLMVGESRVRTFLGYSGPGRGSSAWVVSGKRTATGQPLLCVDPHGQPRAPGQLVPFALTGGNLEVAGLALPGVPGILSGYTRSTAWALTAAHAADADIFIEKLNPENPGEAMHRGVFKPMQRHRELFRTKGHAEPIHREVRETAHGPVISDLSPAAAESGTVLALRWTGHAPSAELDAIYKLNHAARFEEARAAAEHISAPALNLLFADRHGHIGYQFAGAVPIRVAGGPRTPVPGWDGEYDWRGMVPFEELPHLLDPIEGFIVTCGNRVVDDRYPHYISHFFEPPYRHQRLVELLAGPRRVTLRDMRTMQLDVYSVWARRFIEDHIQPWAARVPFVEVELEEPLRQLLGWDGDATPDSVGAALFYTLFSQLADILLKPKLGERLFNEYFQVSALGFSSFERWLAEQPRTTELDDTIARAFRMSVRKLTDRFGPRVGAWRWGTLHTVQHRHPLADATGADDAGAGAGPWGWVTGAASLAAASATAALFNPPPYPCGGDATTINAAAFNPAHGSSVTLAPVARLVCDLANPNANEFALPLGVSGHPTSPDYTGTSAAWQSGQPFRLGLDRGDVERRGSHLVVTPPRGRTKAR
jgi:penicillin G amidase